MVRRAVIAVAMLVAAAGGIVSASAIALDPKPDHPAADYEQATGVEQRGTPVDDPRGGPPWAVRSNDTTSGQRCVTVGRTDGVAFGPVDSSGRVLDAGRARSGMCGNVGDNPLQVGLAEFADTAGTGPRSVLFGIADASVERIAVSARGVEKIVDLDEQRTFAEVREGLSADDDWTIIATLRDGTEVKRTL